MDNAEQKAFLDEFLKYQSRLYGYIATLLPRPDQADDVFCEVSLVLWKKWSQFDRSTEFLPWARAVAYNEVRNFVRRRANREIHLGDSVMELLEKTRQSLDPEMERRQELLEDCLQGLVDKERDLLERHYYRRECAKIIGASLGIAPSTVYTRLHRIRQFLFDCVNDRYERETNQKNFAK